MSVKLTNFGKTTLNGTINNSTTSIVVTDGSVFPTAGDFYIRIEDEIMKVTSRSTNTLTAVRASDGSAAASHTSGVDVKEVASAEFFKRLGSVLHPSTTVAGRDAAATANEGQIFFPTDGIYHYRSDGTSWLPWGPIFPLVEPIDANYAWINQGSASVDTSRGGVYLEAPIESGTSNLRVRKKSAPSTPYTITGAFIPFMPPQTGVFPGVGLLFRESATSKITTFGWNHENDPATTPIVRVALTKWTSATVFSANYGTQSYQNIVQFLVGPLVWFQIANDGTNLSCKYSNDGLRFSPSVKTVAKNDFFTTAPDEVGFYALSNNNNTPVGLWMLHWKEA